MPCRVQTTPKHHLCGHLVPPGPCESEEMNTGTPKWRILLSEVNRTAILAYNKVHLQFYYGSNISILRTVAAFMVLCCNLVHRFSGSCLAGIQEV